MARPDRLKGGCPQTPGLGGGYSDGSLSLSRQLPDGGACLSDTPEAPTPDWRIAAAALRGKPGSVVVCVTARDEELTIAALAP
jgi:hypothetical protein